MTLQEFIELLRFWKQHHVIVSDNLFTNSAVNKNRIVQLLKPEAKISSLKVLKAFGEVFTNCQRFQLIPMETVLELKTEDLIQGECKII